jgi:hypothetical protein
VDVINRPQFNEGLARLLGLKGRPRMELAHDIGLHLGFEVGDLAYFGLGYRAAGRSGVTAVAAEYSHAWFEVAQRTLFQLRRLVIENREATAQDFFLGYITAANAATIGTDATAATYDMSSGNIGTLRKDVQMKFGRDVSNFVIPWQARQIPAGTTVVIDLEHGGWVQDGSQENNFGGSNVRCHIAVSKTAANTELTVGFEGLVLPSAG